MIINLHVMETADELGLLQDHTLNLVVWEGLLTSRLLISKSYCLTNSLQSFMLQWVTDVSFLAHPHLKKTLLVFQLQVELWVVVEHGAGDVWIPELINKN